MTMGISCDGAGVFLPKFLEKGILDTEPFKSINADWVKWLVYLSAAKGRSANPNLPLAVCSEHGKNPTSIIFFDQIALDYLLCLLFSILVAQLA